MLPIVPESALNDIAHVIQLAIAPVFLLTAVAAIIGVLANRLARIVDRIRVLDERRPGAQDPAPLLRELGLLDRRLRLVYGAMACAVSCALLVGLLIVVAFADAFVRLDLTKIIAVLFVLAMLAYILALVVFLREIFLAVFAAHRRSH